MCSLSKLASFSFVFSNRLRQRFVIPHKAQEPPFPNTTTGKSNEPSDTGPPLEPWQTALTSLLPRKVVHARKGELRSSLLQGCVVHAGGTLIPKHSPPPAESPSDLLSLQGLPPAHHTAQLLVQATSSSRKISSPLLHLPHLMPFAHRLSPPSHICYSHASHAVPTAAVSAPATCLEKLSAF